MIKGNKFINSFLIGTFLLLIVLSLGVIIGLSATPNTSNVKINSTDIYNDTTGNVTCYATIIDDNSTMQAYYSWYKNNAAVSGFSTTAYTWTSDDTEDAAGSEGGALLNPTNAYDESWSTYASTTNSIGNNIYENYTWNSNFVASNGNILLQTLSGKVGAANNVNVSNNCLNYSSSSWVLFSSYQGAGAYTNNTIPTDCISSNNPLQLKTIFRRTNADAGSAYLYENRIWYNQSSTIATIYNQTLNNNTETLISTINTANLTAGDNWTCSVMAGDGESNETDWNNATIIINAIDNLFPTFSNYYHNNASLYGQGRGLFNATLTNTNGTVFLEINGANYTASNLTSDVYNVSILLNNGTFSYYWGSWGNGSAKKYNVSEIRSYTLLDNFAPNNPSVIINSSDGSNLATQNLNCYSTIIDKEGGKINVSVQWYKNNIKIFTIDYNNSYENNTFFNSNLSSGNLTAGEEWKCSMKLYDGEFYSSWSNSSSLTILATPAIDTGSTTASGGGGGSSVTIKKIEGLKVIPSTFILQESVGLFNKGKVSLQYSGNSKINISVHVLYLKNIQIKENNFELSRGQSKDIEFTLLPFDIPGVYTGKLKLISRGDTLEIPLNINVNSERALFDVSLDIPKTEEMIDATKGLKARINLTQMGLKGKMDIKINYIIKDFAEETYYQDSETIMVDSSKDFVKEINTNGLLEGEYVLGVEVIYSGGVATASAQFSILSSDPLLSPKKKLNTLVLLGAVIFVFTLLLIMFFLYRIPPKNKIKKI